MLKFFGDLFLAILIYLLGRFWESIPKSLRHFKLKRFFTSYIQTARFAIVYGTLQDPRPRYNSQGKRLSRFKKEYTDERIIKIAGPFENIVGDCEIRSAGYLAQSIGRFQKQNIKILSDIEAYKDLDYTLINLGSSSSNEVSDFMLAEDSNIFYRFGRDEDKDENFIERISDSYKFIGFQPPKPKDIGLIMRLKNCRFPNKFLFICAGLGEWGTSGTSWYLAEYWEKLYKEFGKKDFGIIVEVGRRLDSSAKRIDSMCGNFKTPH